MTDLTNLDNLKKAILKAFDADDYDSLGLPPIEEIAQSFKDAGNFKDTNELLEK